MCDWARFYYFCRSPSLDWYWKSFSAGAEPAQTFSFGKSIHYCSSVPLLQRDRPVRTHHRFHCTLAGLRISFHRLFRVNFLPSRFFPSAHTFSLLSSLFSAPSPAQIFARIRRLFIICMEQESMFAFDLNPPHQRQREEARDQKASVSSFFAASKIGGATNGPVDPAGAS